MNLILVLILGVSAFWLWRGLVRAKKDIAARVKELETLRASLDSWRASVQREAADSLEKSLSVFRTNELAVARELIRKEYELEFARWKTKETATQRADAIKQSKAVNRGLVAEQLAPHMAGFQYNPKDCHFVGKPVDYIIFAGLDAGNLDKIVLLEVKTGESGLNAREKQVRDAIVAGRVSYEIFKLEASDGDL